MDRSTYNDNDCPLFRLPLEIREEVYSYVANGAQRRVFQGSDSMTPVAFLSSVGCSTEQPAVLTTKTGLSCACKRTRREFSQALHLNTSKIAVHVTDLNFSPFIAFHKIWMDRDLRKYPRDLRNTCVQCKSTSHSYCFQGMRSGCIMFVHWDNSNSGPCGACRYGSQHNNCWRQRNIRVWLGYQQHLERDHARMVDKHWASTDKLALVFGKHEKMERMLKVIHKRTVDMQEDHGFDLMQKRIFAKRDSKRNTEQQSGFLENEESREIVTASSNMKKKNTN